MPMLGRLILLLGVVLAVASAGASRAGAPRKPNVVFIMADDLGYGELGCYGQKLIKTPNIDRLASDGMRFTHYYAGSTVCAPSRSVLMTGQHAGHTWVRANAPGAAQALRDEDVTVAELMRKAGYTTGLTGKWGLGDTIPAAERGLPNRQGFDFFYGYHNQAHAHNYYPPFLYRNEQKVNLPNEGDFRPNGSGVATVKKVFSHDLVLDESLKFLEANRAKPFFFYLAWTLPHANNEANRDLKNGTEVPDLGIYKDREWTLQQKGHAAMVTYLDTQVGKVLEALKRLGLEENTLVFFTSDNGPQREDGSNPEFFEASGPVRGIKRDLYDGGIRVPMIVRWPGRIERGSTSDHLSYHGDLMATLGDLLKTEAPTATDSISYLPTLRGQNRAQQQHRYLYWEFYEGGSRQAVRQGKWKAVRQPMLTGPVEIYDILADPKELKNLSAEQPERVKEMERLMAEAHVPSPNFKVPAR
jgi:arylsulfatase A-like enzyme